MTKFITYQCLKCGRTVDTSTGFKPASQNCTKGGKCDWRSPVFFR